MSDSAVDQTRLSTLVPNPLYRKLETAARRRGVSIDRVVRESLELNTLLLDEEAADAKVLIEHPDGRMERIVRR